MSKTRKPQLPKEPPRPDGGESQHERVQRLLTEGARLLAARRPGEALPLLTEAWQLAPDNVAVAINLGGAYVLQGRHRLAVPILEAAAKLEPDNPMVWTNLAAALLGKLPLSTAREQDRAIEAYERALALDPRAPNVHYNLGLIYKDQGAWERARLCFQQALEVDPNDRDARRWLDWLARIEADLQGSSSSPDSTTAAKDG